MRSARSLRLGLARNTFHSPLQSLSITPPYARKRDGLYYSTAKKRTADRVAPYGDTVWSEFTPLALRFQAMNLGQGFPDFPAPDFILSAAQTAIGNHLNQYTRMQGHLRLVNALARFYSPLFDRELDPLNNLLTTIGCTEGLFAACAALLNPGDQAIVFEPFYDVYPADIELPGGTPIYIPLRIPKGKHNSGDWKIDLNELESKITPKTRLMILNNPMNVPGKVFTRQELEGLANIAKKYDLIVLSDEVYEWMVYDNQQHVRIATLPGMFDRTLTFGSAGKSFSVTGWKVGWMIGPKDLRDAVGVIHQFDCFSFATPLQEAVAVAFEQAKERKYFEELKEMYDGKRRKLVNMLEKSGLRPIAPQGSYFVVADTSEIKDERFMNFRVPEGILPPGKEMAKERDYQFCRWLTCQVGVAAIPPSAFYSEQNKHLAQHLARFTFCKRDEVLDAAAERLLKMPSV